MKKQRIFNDVLNECIERILKGVTVEACLKSFPEYAAELEPILRTAADTKKAAAIKPSHAFRQRAANEFQAAVRELGPIRGGERQQRAFPRWHLGWMGAVSVVIAIIAAGTGTVAAANNSQPDQPLYTVKLVTEDMRLVLTTSPLGKAELYAEFTDKRVDEIVRMADKGNAAQVEKATGRLNEQLGAIANLTLPVGEADTTVSEASVEQAATEVSIPSSGQGTAPATPIPTLTLEPATEVDLPRPELAPAPEVPEQAPPDEPSTAPAATLTPTPGLTINPATPTPTPAVTVKPTPATIPSTAVKPTPTPAPAAAVSKTPQPTSANITATRNTAEQQIKTVPPTGPAITRTFTPEEWDRFNKERQQNELRNTVFQQAERNNRQLEELLKRVPDNMKPFLKKAIESAGKGYDEALKNIDRKR